MMVPRTSAKSRDTSPIIAVIISRDRSDVCGSGSSRSSQRPKSPATKAASAAAMETQIAVTTISLPWPSRRVVPVCTNRAGNILAYFCPTFRDICSPTYFGSLQNCGRRGSRQQPNEFNLSRVSWETTGDVWPGNTTSCLLKNAPADLENGFAAVVPGEFDFDRTRHRAVQRSRRRSARGTWAGYFLKDGARDAS